MLSRHEHILHLTGIISVWSLAMVYRADGNIPLVDVLYRAIAYVPMCFGVKSLVSYDRDLHNLWCSQPTFSIPADHDY